MAYFCEPLDCAAEHHIFSFLCAFLRIAVADCCLRDKSMYSQDKKKNITTYVSNNTHWHSQSIAIVTGRTCAKVRKLQPPILTKSAQSTTRASQAIAFAIRDKHRRGSVS
jgi:hypothetical protein